MRTTRFVSLQSSTTGLELDGDDPLIYTIQGPAGHGFFQIIADPRIDYGSICKIIGGVSHS
jgi:hypothetical protein